MLQGKHIHRGESQHRSVWRHRANERHCVYTNCSRTFASGNTMASIKDKPIVREMIHVAVSQKQSTRGWRITSILLWSGWLVLRVYSRMEIKKSKTTHECFRFTSKHTLQSVKGSVVTCVCENKTETHPYRLGNHMCIVHKNWNDLVHTDGSSGRRTQSASLRSAPAQVCV